MKRKRKRKFRSSFVINMDKDQNNIKVLVRCKPQPNNSEKIVSVTNDKKQIIIPMNPQTSRSQTGQSSFSFDYVYDDKAEQSDVFDHGVGGDIQGLFEGRNVSIIAYGQTGSGKTHTMGLCAETGIDNEGIIPRAITTIFENKDS